MGVENELLRLDAKGRWEQTVSTGQALTRRLLVDRGGNTVADHFPKLPPGTTISVIQADGKQTVGANYGAGGWTQPDVTLPAGEIGRAHV